MKIFRQMRLAIRVLAGLLLSFMLVQVVQADAGAVANEVIFGKSDPDICWKDSYGRGVGEVPKVCPQGYERTGADLLCYPVCDSGFSGVGPVCWQNCPGGFRNDGAFCAKPEPYGRGAGYPWKFGDGLDLDDASRRCRRDNPQGCEQNGAIIYPKCRAGYTAVGCCICSPECPSDMGTDIGVSCTKKSYGRGVGEGGTCPAGQQQDFKGGLCYPNCTGSADGVGPVCWSTCPADFPVNCGAACGVDAASCAFAIMEQVQSTADVGLNVAALVTTAGTANAALKAAQTAGRSTRRTLTKQARTQLRNQAKRQIQQARKYQRAKGRVDQTGEYLGESENVTATADMLVDVYESGEFDFTQLQPSVADVEPTGMLALVNSFNKPICGTPAAQRAINGGGSNTASSASATASAGTIDAKPGQNKPIVASAAEFVKFQNRWKSTEYLNIERGSLQSGPIQPDWWSARWILEPVAGTDFVRLKNYWKKDQYINIETGPVRSSAIQPSWWSAQWLLQKVPGTTFVRLQSRWKSKVFLHIENGRLEAGPIQPGWWSAQWQMR